MSRFLSFVQKYQYQRVAGGIDGCQRLRTIGLEDVIIVLDETGALLANIVVLDLPVDLSLETAINGTPLVASFLHILPVEPCFRLQILDIIEEALNEFQVTFETSSA